MRPPGPPPGPPPEVGARVDPVVVLGGLTILVGLVLRLTSLDADPLNASWTGWVTDEGRWTELAREWVVFGAFDLDSPISRLHAVVGPLFQAVSALVFGVFGATLASARLVSAMAGLGILIVTAALLRRRVGLRVTVVVVGLLAVQPDLVLFGRVAIPEMLALFFETCAFALLVGGRRTPRRAFLAGVALAVALGVKATLVPVIPAFAAMVWWLGDSREASSRRVRLGAFLLALAVPAAVVLGLYAILTGSSGRFAAASGSLTEVVAFLRLDSLYGVVTVLYAGEWTGRANVVLAGLWGTSLLVLLRGAPPGPLRDLFVGALLWFLGWLVPWAVLLYFPERYVVHLHVPLLIGLGAGLSLLGRPGKRTLEQALDAIPPGLRRLAVASCLAVPIALAAAPWLMSLLRTVGLSPDGLGHHVLGVVGLVAALGWSLTRTWTPRAVVAVGLAAPAAAALVWTGGDALALLPERFWGSENGSLALPWTGFVLTTLAVTWVWSRAPTRGPSPARTASAFAVVLGLFWGGVGAARHADRPHVLAEARRFLEDRYPAGSTLGTRGAATVFLGTTFRYDEDFSDEAAPDVVVWMGPRDEVTGPPGYHLVGEFFLELGPRFQHAPVTSDRIRVMERPSSRP